MEEDWPVKVAGILRYPTLFFMLIVLSGMAALLELIPLLRSASSADASLPPINPTRTVGPSAISL